VNSAVELAVRDIDVDTKTTEGFTKAEQMLKEIILWGQQNGEFTPDYDTEELAEYLHNVLVGLRGMARTSTAKEKTSQHSQIIDEIFRKMIRFF
jgi:TetR/AcrR family transcriptional repressor of nem operon